MYFPEKFNYWTDWSSDTWTKNDLSAWNKRWCWPFCLEILSVFNFRKFEAIQSLIASRLWCIVIIKTFRFKWNTQLGIISITRCMRGSLYWIEWAKGETELPAATLNTLWNMMGEKLFEVVLFMPTQCPSLSSKMATSGYRMLHLNSVI